MICVEREVAGSSYCACGKVGNKDVRAMAGAVEMAVVMRLQIMNFPVLWRLAKKGLQSVNFLLLWKCISYTDGGSGFTAATWYGSSGFTATVHSS